MNSVFPFDFEAKKDEIHKIKTIQCKLIKYDIKYYVVL